MRTTCPIPARIARILIAAPLLLASCDRQAGSALSSPSSDGADPASSDGTQAVSMTLTVKGMHCEGCEGAICGKVGKIPGVASVKASHAEEKVEVTAPEGSRGEIVAAIKKLGYKIEE